MFGKKASKPQSRIDCLIGAGTVIKGDITFSGGLRIDGRVHGNVVAAADQSGTLVLSELASIEGEVRVSHAVINGTVTGPLNAREYLELQAKANVTGDIHYSRFEMQLGAIVQGRLLYESANKQDKVVVLKTGVAD